MPTIKRKQIQEKKVNYKKEKAIHAGSFYNSSAWTRLRNTFLTRHPLCQCCLDHGRVEAAKDIHHKIPWDRGETEIEKWDLFLKESNLMAVCERCHLGLHAKDKQYHMGSLDSLTDTEYNYIHGLNYK